MQMLCMGTRFGRASAGVVIGVGVDVGVALRCALFGGTALFLMFGMRCLDRDVGIRTSRDDTRRVDCGV